jgi:hypothetical protein
MILTTGSKSVVVNVGNPNHDEKGRFADGPGGGTDVIRPKGWALKWLSTASDKKFAAMRDPKTSEGKAFTKFLNDQPVYMGKTFRGVVLSDDDVRKMTSGSYYMLPVHSSSSKDLSTAEDFLGDAQHSSPGKTPVLLEMHGHGADLKNVMGTQYKGVREVVLKAGTKYVFAGNSFEAGYQRLVFREKGKA